MLALTRKKNEAIMLDGNIEITILDINGDKVKIGIKAPKSVSIHRKEIYNQIKKSNQEATSIGVEDVVNLEAFIDKIK